MPRAVEQMVCHDGGFLSWQSSQLRTECSPVRQVHIIPSDFLIRKRLAVGQKPEKGLVILLRAQSDRVSRFMSAQHQYQVPRATSE